LWLHLLKRFAGMPDARGLEIGCFEGRSSVWFLENILTTEGSLLYCIDKRFSPAFRDNIATFQDRVVILEERSQVALRSPSLPLATFQFIYVDGNHRAAFVLEDGVLAFRLLCPGGCLIFDDYRWSRIPAGAAISEPKIAIDSFLTVYEGHYRLLHKDAQVAIEKLCPLDPECVAECPE
jgi:predicted O-methyltransferase YrrM